jgi:hypothetical protein
VKTQLKSLAGRLLDSVATVRHVPIEHCYHYRGYRYGGFGDNAYEDYVLGLARKDAVPSLRQRFAWVVLNCRARTMAEALQIELPEGWPLWEYPWSRRPVGRGTAVPTPQENPDIMCHFSPGGVLASHVNREFGWLEAAWDSISRSGYQPTLYGYIRCMELSSPTQSRYIVLDGNHRISAMHAAGLRTAAVQVLRLRRVRRERASAWRRVRDGSLDAESALRIFDRYFAQRNPSPVPRHAARLLRDEPPLWPEQAGEPHSPTVAVS